MIKVWKERWGEKWDEIQEKVRAWWLQLLPREKIILSSLAGLLTVLLLALAIKETSLLFTEVTSMAENNLKNIERIQSLVRDLQTQRGDILRYERLLEKRGENFVLADFLDSEAKKFGLSIAKTTPARVVGDDDRQKKEEWLNLELKDASLDSLVKFFESIESTLGLKLVELGIKSQFQDPTKLDANLIVSSLKTL